MYNFGRRLYGEDWLATRGCPSKGTPSLAHTIPQLRNTSCAGEASHETHIGLDPGAINQLGLVIAYDEIEWSSLRPNCGKSDGMIMQAAWRRGGVGEVLEGGRRTRGGEVEPAA